MEKIFKYLIIGGGIAGTSASEEIRALDGRGSIAIVSDEPYRLYSRIMLSKPNFFLEKIPFDTIWLKKESWYQENNISFIFGKSATMLDSKNKIIVLNDGEKIRYEKLLLAIGGCARRLTVPGAEKKGVFVLRTLNEARAIIAGTKTARRAVAIGGGFASFEMCEMLRIAGIEVSLCVREKRYWENILDETSARMIEEAFLKGGVILMKDVEVAEFTGSAFVDGVLLNNGKKIPCEMAVVGVGLFCPFSWIQTAGIAVNRGIIGNEYLETNVSDIWTAGDAAEFNDLILGETIQLGNWVNAQMQGRIAGRNMAGKKEPFRFVSFYTTQGFGITIAFVGDARPLPDRTVITRGSREENSFVRLLMYEGRVVGATLINRTKEISAISKIIEKRTLIVGKEKELSNLLFDLSSLA
ncbi:MAG: FAD-dependent oxidoreductase [Patescibacteria group bacterium]